MIPPVVVKLGGSVLTDKARYRTPRLPNIARLAHELSASRAPIILVHGAGSYGHVVAKTHDLSRGDDGDANRRAAFTQVHADVRELTTLLLAALREAGVAAVSHSTYDLARLDDGKLLSFHAPGVAETLRAGFTPVLSGDGVLDASRGFGILSGDVLMVELARAFAPSMVIFVTDVDGIYDKDPREPGALLLREIDWRASAGASSHPDITGGMAGKLARARDVAEFSPVRVINGLVPGRLSDLLQGKDVVGTIVRA